MPGQHAINSADIEAYDNYDPSLLYSTDTTVAIEIAKNVETHADFKCVTFLDDHGHESSSLNYFELDRRSRACATFFHDAGLLFGDRVLVLTLPGLDFVTAFIGCMYYGLVAVPCYPPLGEKNVDKMFVVGRDCRPKAIILSEDLYKMMEEAIPMMEEQFGLGKLKWFSLGRMNLDTFNEPRCDSRWRSWLPTDPDSVAFVQYTSGSTGAPKGVVITHRNFMSQGNLIKKNYKMKPDDVLVTWLPPYHDMGLVGCVVSPLIDRVYCIMMSPLAFLKKPLLWLETISKYRGTVSGGPNFAFEMILQKTKPEDINKLSKPLDLSCWEIAFTGAEPIRYKTLRDFASTFAKFGFKYNSFYPSYGMAEATLMISGHMRGYEPVVEYVDAAAFENRKVVYLEPNEHNAASCRTMVGCGYPKNCQRILIVDPDTREVCRHDNITAQIGEIWVENNPSIAQGFFERDQETEDIFRARVQPENDNDGPSAKFYLRTGDLGFIGRDGSLFVCGRIKDLMIVRGRNLYPQDLEATVEACQGTDQVLRKGCCAVFSVDEFNDKDGESEKIVLVSEVTENYATKAKRDQSVLQELDDLMDRIRRQIAVEHFVHVESILLIQPQTLPKTTSGKIQRRFTKEQFIKSAFKVVRRNDQKGKSVARPQPQQQQQQQPATTTATTSTNHGSNDSTNSRQKQQITQRIVSRMAEILEIPEQDVDVYTPFMEQGLDSIKLQLLMAELGDVLASSSEQHPSLQISPTLFFKYPNIVALVDHLCNIDNHSKAGPLADGKTNNKDNDNNEDNAVAIIGMSCRFPQASSPAEFWQNLINGVDSISTVSQERLRIFRASGSVPSDEIQGGFIENVFDFDHEFFGISRREALDMDPQQRLMLQLSIECLEDAGITMDQINNSKAGVFVGASTSDFALLQHANAKFASDMHATTGSALSIIANRISYLLNLHGPSMVVDSACSSSLLSVHLAYQSLQSGESTVALAGGVNLILSDAISENLRNANFLSPDFRCKAFSANANGYVRGEGAGMVVLKKLSRAIQDGDRIYAVIRGSAVVQDGKSNGLTAPNQLAQEQVIREAFTTAQLDPSACEYIETHGTGTLLGDTIEAAAIGSVVGASRDPSSGPCLIGSVKSNIGHLESGAGVAGLIKLALAIHNGQIPPTLHLNGRPNPHIPFEQLRIKPQTELTEWKSTTRTSGVSSFGFGGTNVHVVVQCPPSTTQSTQSAVQQLQQQTGDYIITLSTRSRDALLNMISSYIAHLQNRPSLSLAMLSYATIRHRTHHRHQFRFASVASSVPELVSKLDAVRTRISSGQNTIRDFSKTLTLVFPGQGVDSISATRPLLQSSPVFRATIEKLDSIFTGLCQKNSTEVSAFSLKEELLAFTGDFASLRSTNIAQCLIFSTQVALVNMWRHEFSLFSEIQSVAVIGHSIGEIAAAVTAGLISLEDAATIIFHRSRVQSRIKGKGKMLIARISPAEVQALGVLDDTRISIAAINSPVSTTLSGAIEALDRVSVLFTERGISHRYLDLDFAFHCPDQVSDYMEQELYESIKGIKVLRNTKSDLPSMYSTVTGKVLSPAESLTDDDMVRYWLTNMKQTVLFADGINSLLADGHNVFFEISGREALCASIQQCAALREEPMDIVVFSAFSKSDTRTILPAVAQLYTLYGSRICLDPVTPSAGLFSKSETLSQLQLPTYAWNNIDCTPAYINDNTTEDEISPTTAPRQAAKRNDRAVVPLNELAARVSVQDKATYEELARRSKQFGDAVNKLCARIVVSSFKKMAWPMDQTGEVVSTTELIRRMHIAPEHVKLLRYRLLAVLLTDAGIIRRVPNPSQSDDNELWEVLQTVDDDARYEPCFDEISRLFPDYSNELVLLKRSAENLHLVLQGKYFAVQVLFPDGDIHTAEAIYEASPISKLYNAMVCKFIEAVTASRPQGKKKLKILEIGAGTGGLTTHVAKQVADVCEQYLFTDISRLFLLRAQEKFQSYSFMEYQVLDVEKEEECRALSGQYDIVLAANVLHATRDLATTLRNAKSLLVPNSGMLVILELTSPTAWLDLTFGLTDGWWRFSDLDLRPQYPLISWDLWRSTLEQCGFREPIRLNPILPEAAAAAAAADDANTNLDDSSLQSVMVAQSTTGRTTTNKTIRGAVAARNNNRSSSSSSNKSATLALHESDIEKIKAELAAAEIAGDDTKLQSVVEQFICGVVAATLLEPISSIPRDQRLDTLGMDSLVAVEMRNIIRKAIGINIPLQALVENPTITAMSCVVVSLYKDRSREQEAHRTDSNGNALAPVAAADAKDNKKDCISSTGSNGIHTTGGGGGDDDDDSDDDCGSSNDNGFTTSEVNIGSTYILAIGNSVPEYCYTQAEMKRLACKYYEVDAPPSPSSTEEEERNAKQTLKAQIERIYENSAITNRYIVLNINEDFDYKGTFATLQQRNRVYEQEAPRLAYRAAEAAIRNWGGDRRRITHVVYVSTTGNKIPGVEFELVGLLGLKPSVERIAINFMGCFGTLPGLKTACAFAAQNPRNRVLMVSTEICSLHLEELPSAENFVGSAIFADGSGAFIVGCDPQPLRGERPLFEVIKTQSFAVPNTTDKMFWNLTNAGYKLGLSRDIPDLLFDHMEPFARALLTLESPDNDYDHDHDHDHDHDNNNNNGNGDRKKRKKLRRKQQQTHQIPFADCYWPIHPGGKAILLATEKACGLDRDQTQASWDVLESHGNMSSATITFVLNRLQEMHNSPRTRSSSSSSNNNNSNSNSNNDGEGTTTREWACCLVFGPGLVVEGALLRMC